MKKTKKDIVFPTPAKRKEIKEAIKLAQSEIKEWSLFIKRMEELLKDK